MAELKDILREEYIKEINKIDLRSLLEVELFISLAQLIRLRCKWSSKPQSR